MQIEIPDQVDEELALALIRALCQFSDSDAPGSRMDALRVADGEVDVRVYDEKPGQPYYERVSI